MMSSRFGHAGHSRSKNGVASLAYVPAIHVFVTTKQDVDARDERGHDGMSLDCPLSRARTEAGAASASLRRQPAVERQGLAGDRSGGVARQIDHRARDL